jgi:hypothetical protein
VCFFVDICRNNYIKDIKMAQGPLGSIKLPKKLGGSQLFWHLLVNFIH